MGKDVVMTVLLFCGTPLFAHRLEVDALRDGVAVKVEAFYPGTGTPASGADITVTDGSGRVVAEGKTDAAGAFTFETQKPGPFTVVATHGAHRSEGEIPAVQPDHGGDFSGSSAGDRPTVRGTSIRRDPVPVLQLVAGLGLIFGAAGFLLAIMARRRLRILSDRLTRLEEIGRDAP